MKRVLKKWKEKFYSLKHGAWEGPASPYLTGSLSGLTGRISPGLTGRISPGLTGSLSGLTGSLSGLTGSLSGLTGSLFDCDLTDEDRAAGVNIADLVEPNETPSAAGVKGGAR